MILNQKIVHRTIDHIFKELMPVQGMAERPEQIALSHRMLNTMLNGGIALCDAGTGIGKTYAYLVAGIAFLRLRAEKRLPFQPILISTSSIALQNAVLNEYIPFLSELMLADGMSDHPIRAVVRKGKRHYVCDERLERRLRQVDLKKKNKAAANALASLLVDLDVDQAERLSGYDRERVCVPSCCDCHRSACRYLAFLHECEVRQYAFQICNHNLLLADAIRRDRDGKPILPKACAVIIDEAHKLPEASRQMFGRTLTAEDIQSIIKALRSEKFLLAAENLSGVSANLINTLAKPPEDKPFSEYARLLIAPERMLAVTQKKLNPELTAPTRRRLRDTSAAAGTLCGEKDDMIRYATETENGETMLCATVSNLSEKLGHTMWKQPRPFLLTSGTLAVGRDFRRFRQEAGLNSGYRVKESVSASPFDYQRNCLLYFPEDPPSMRNPNYFEDLTAEILSLLNASHGHALVLFTSYAAMSAVKERLLRENLRWPLFAMSRNAVYTAEQFKRSPGAVLLATGAAWEGFDFPGDAVSMLIIPRLPFPQPNALKEKEREKYDTLKKFIRTVVVPEMQIKLRQGFGRAIRTETDTCAVAILDERAGIGGRYHRDVLSALPRISQASHIEAVGSFFREKKSAQYFAEGQENADSA